MVYTKIFQHFKSLITLCRPLRYIHLEMLGAAAEIPYFQNFKIFYMANKCDDRAQMAEIAILLHGDDIND